MTGTLGDRADTGPTRHPVDGPWEHCEAIVDGLRIHYVTAGPEDGESVLLLHGFPECWYVWHRQIPALVEAGYRVIAPDLRGYGRSEKPHGVAAYRLDRLVGDVCGLLETLDAAPARLVGHDWGGMLAWEVAARRPDVVERLGVCNGPHGGAYERALRSAEQLRRSWYALWFQVPWLPEGLLGAWNAYGLTDVFDADVFDPGEVEVYRRAASQPGALRSMIDYYRALGRGQLRGFVTDLVPGRERPPGALQARHIDVPTLVCWGMDDPALVPANVELLDRWVSDLRRERYPDAGHWALVERSEAVTDALLEFFGEDV